MAKLADISDIRTLVDTTGFYVVRCALGEWTADYARYVAAMPIIEKMDWNFAALQAFQLCPNNQRLTKQIGARGDTSQVELSNEGLHLATRLSVKHGVSLQNTVALAIIGYLAKGGYPGQTLGNIWKFYRRRA